LRVHFWRDSIITRIVPVAAPLVNVLAHVEESVAVRFAPADGFGTVAPTAGLRRGQRAAPGV
jgi:hypothetical protein